MMSSRFYCACVPLQVPSSPISKTAILASVVAFAVMASGPSTGRNGFRCKAASGLKPLADTALCARTAPQQMSSTGQLSSATLPHQNLATLRNWASGRSMSRPVPATSWPEPGARRAPRRTSDISQPVRLT